MTTSFGELDDRRLLDRERDAPGDRRGLDRDPTRALRSPAGAPSADDTRTTGALRRADRRTRRREPPVA